MKKHATLMALSVSVIFASAQIADSSTFERTKKASIPAAQTERLKTTQSSAASSHASHLFPVNDVKGLLLTCIAPDIDTNGETDVFEDCRLAPGRTLEDVMHTFIGAIHYVQKQQTEEHSERTGEVEERSEQKPEQK